MEHIVVLVTSYFRYNRVAGFSVLGYRRVWAR
jgi:hypothetical protein